MVVNRTCFYLRLVVILLIPLLCLYFLLLFWRIISTALSPFCFPHLVFWCQPENVVLLGVLWSFLSQTEVLPAPLSTSCVMGTCYS